ncbi:MAG: MFS transporter [Streptomycetaceae bacterium]|nr:MAG: MFS transporter [Streptomycetaceae bacterium]
MLTPYRKLFATPGGLAFSIPGLIARLPIAMTYLSVTFIVVHETDSYTLAGTISTGAALINAAFSPLWSRKADQLGQSKVLRYTIPSYIIFGLLFIFTITHNSPTLVWMTCIFIAEAFLPNIGGLVRRRWLHTLGEKEGSRPLINTAYSFEALVDEIVFTIGPLIASAAAISIAPQAGMYFAFSFMSVGTGLYILQKKSEPPPHPIIKGEKRTAVLTIPNVQAVFLPYIFLGVFFMSTTLSTIAFADQHGAKSSTGIILAIWSGGSAVSALINGAIKWKITDGQRFIYLVIAMFFATIPLLFSHSILVLSIVLFLNGFGVAPILVAGYSIVEKSVSAAKVTETFAWILAGLQIGNALPGPISGYMIDHYSADRSFIVPVIALLLTILSFFPYLKVWRVLIKI